MKQKAPIAININFDSLNENLGFPKGYYDPSFFEVFDRFIEFSNKYDFKYSIYIIGKDLEKPEIYDRVKDWSLAGHEIGNHTYSHKLNLGGLKKEEIKIEILKSHELITKCIGHEPKGFISPGWSTSKRVVSELIDLEYLYDTSLFPSYLMYPATLKNALNHIRRFDKFKEILNRRDYLYPFTKPLTPFFADEEFKKTEKVNKKKIVILPLPTLNRVRMPLWHTLHFIFGSKQTNKQLGNYLLNNEYLYYLMHPADLTGAEDLDKEKYYTIERMNVSLSSKTQALTETFDLIKASGRKIVTMKELALRFIDKSALK